MDITRCRNERLKRRVEHRCLHRVASFGRLGYGIHFRLAKLTDVDKDLELLMREAYSENAPARDRTQRVPQKRMHPTAAAR